MLISLLSREPIRPYADGISNYKVTGVDHLHPEQVRELVAQEFGCDGRWHTNKIDYFQRVEGGYIVKIRSPYLD